MQERVLRFYLLTLPFICCDLYIDDDFSKIETIEKKKLFYSKLSTLPANVRFDKDFTATCDIINFSKDCLQA